MFRMFAAAAALLCVGCQDNQVPLTRGTPQPTNAPNGDVTTRTDRAAPDTPVGRQPAKGFRDNAIDTDPSSPRTRDRGQQVEVPVLSQ